jgi:hypothetical protein
VNLFPFKGCDNGLGLAESLSVFGHAERCLPLILSEFVKCRLIWMLCRRRQTD